MRKYRIRTREDTDMAKYQRIIYSIEKCYFKFLWLEVNLAFSLEDASAIMDKLIKERDKKKFKSEVLRSE